MSRELHHFLLLTVTEQAEAIKRMAASGWSEYTIAAASRLSVEQVRRVLAERAEVVVADSAATVGSRP